MFSKRDRLSEVGFEALPADSNARLLETMSSVTDRVCERQTGSSPILKPFIGFGGAI
jgi:hypothetical protein